MTGKDWFIVGARLGALFVAYTGIQHVLIYLTRDMFFVNLDPNNFLQPNYGWTNLVTGGIYLAIGVVLLLKADTLADWCYGVDKKRGVKRDSDDDAGFAGAPYREEDAGDHLDDIKKKDY